MTQLVVLLVGPTCVFCPGGGGGVRSPGRQVLSCLLCCSDCATSSARRLVDTLNFYHCQPSTNAHTRCQRLRSITFLSSGTRGRCKKKKKNTIEPSIKKEHKNEKTAAGLSEFPEILAFWFVPGGITTVSEVVSSRARRGNRSWTSLPWLCAVFLEPRCVNTKRKKQKDYLLQ